MADVTLKDVCKIYPGNVKAVDSVNLYIKDREFVVLVGPSGCGKSTTLRMVAGLEEISSGTISIGTRVVNDVPPKDRDIAMVFQNYALYPHMTVYENMAFGLKLRKFKKTDIDKRVQEAAEILGIKEYLHRRPKALSGGQRQRVAVGRAIVRKPEAFLFDEPLSNLDAKMRVQMRTEISKLHTRLETTMVYVTHDQIEAMTMADRIVVMKDGIVQQVDTPLNVYDRPATIFVAGFIGTPPMNFFKGVLIKQDGKLYFKEGATLIKFPEEWTEKAEPFIDKKIVFGIRPEDVGSPEAESKPGASKIKAKVEVIEPMGAETYLYLNTGDQSFISRVDSHRKTAVGEDIELSVLMSKSHLFDAVTEKFIL
ncbi:MAG TPA: sugar ABC transporter ATP-binding protein [Lentisphaeria bacterium]|nr:MAG: sugar ABC transporter ATP-binding protein [Lentisphaerae bacterium GWF2_49_21]HBC88277.1 sugar ABC transporter ATP-binding protein [Lentisphaeria bacterium]